MKIIVKDEPRFFRLDFKNDFDSVSSIKSKDKQ